jgi:integrase/recombinase XerD
LVREYLSHLRVRKFSPRTLRDYRNRLKPFFVFLAERGSDRLQDVEPGDIEQYRLLLSRQDLAPATTYAYLRAVRSFFAFLEAHQHLFASPTRTLSLPRPAAKLQPVPSEAEIRRLLGRPNTSTPLGARDRAIIELLYSTAVRLEEFVRLNLYDVDMPAGSAAANPTTLRIRRGKGGKGRVVPLGAKALFWLKSYLNHVRPALARRQLDEHALFLGKLGRRIHPRTLGHILKAYGLEARIKTPITPHALRRACATHMLRRGAHPVMIQMLLGHSSLKSLSQYLKITITDLKKIHAKSKPGR